MRNTGLSRLVYFFVITLILLNGFAPAGAAQPSNRAAISSGPLRATPGQQQATGPSVPGATQRVITGPPGSGEFGSSVTVLPNGNIVVTDPMYDDGAVVDIGAVYLYDGYSLALISVLKGSTAYDEVGRGGVTILSSGSYLVNSYFWSVGTEGMVGAVTWCSGTSGCSGVVSAANSLVGSTSGDMVGSGGIIALSNGNYVVKSHYWDAPGPLDDVGAVTWCPGPVGSGGGGCFGLVSAANSLVGSTAGDQVGNSGITLLSNGNYVVKSYRWDAPGPVADVGAVTWCSGVSGCSGVVSAANSLVGSTADDRVGAYGITPLGNGSYVVQSHLWDAPGPVADAGAVTWCGGTTGCQGTVSAANSLVGGTASDQVGRCGITVLTNGSYVVSSDLWDAPGPMADVGAVTWCPGATGPGGGGCQGQVSAANSLVGSTPGDQVGRYGITVLTNGNYVVRSAAWDAPGPLVNMGAVTWCDGTGGCSGPISAANSLVGSAADDAVGSGGITPLNNGSYVVSTPYWDAPGPLANAGAVTWCDGTGGCSGPISAANSLLGSTAGDQVGFGGSTALGSGNYVVPSPYWDAPVPVVDVGAVTWCSGTSGCSGAVSAANSLVGSTAGDQVGHYWIAALSNGSYVVSSRVWDAPGSAAAPGPVVDAGAVTWCSGTSGCSEAVSAANSLVGATAGDVVGDSITELSSGNYVVRSDSWDAPGPVANVGAITWCAGASGCSGAVSSANSLVGWGVVTPLANGSYVVSSPSWDAPGPVLDVGAVTWCSGTSGCQGDVSPANSLVGNTAGDEVGFWGVTALSSGSYLVNSPSWDAPGPLPDVRAVTLAAGYAAFPVGAVSFSNSVTGAVTNSSLASVFDALNDHLVVGLKLENRVVVFKQPHTSLHTGAWNTPDTWDYGAPVERSDVQVSNGAIISLSAPAAARNLALTSGRIVLGSHDLAVDQSLTLNGPPGVDRMVVADGTGALRKRFTGPGSFTFPVGDQTGTPEYSPFTASFTSGSFAPDAYVAVRVANAKHPANPSASYLQRYWSMTHSGISDFTYGAAMNYTPADVVGTEADLFGLKYDAGSWLSGSQADAASHTCSFSGLDSFSDFTAGEGLAVTIDDPRPATPSNDNTPTFHFSATGSGAPFSYAFRLDNSAWSPPTAQTSATFPAQVDGSHTFWVRAGNSLNVQSTAASYTFVIDTQPPLAPTISSPANGSLIPFTPGGWTQPTFSGTADASAALKLYRTPGDTLLCTATVSAGGIWSCQSPPLPVPGLYRLYAAATDAAGNTSPPSSTTNFVIQFGIYLPSIGK